MPSENKDSVLFEVNVKKVDARTLILFIQTSDVVLKYAEAVLNKIGLSLIKLMVLQLLEVHGGTLTPSKIAQLTLREKHVITTQIRRMEKDQLVSIKRNTKDKRSFNVSITQKGKRAVASAIPVSRGVVKQAMSSIPDSSAGVLEELLRVLRQNSYNGLERMKNR